MSWMTRAATALVLASAVGALPLILDHCAASCEAHEALAKNGAQPACHHAVASAARIGEKPTPCGHDHHGTTATVGSNPVMAERGAVSVVAVASIPQAVDLMISHRIDRSGMPPGLPSTPHDRSLPLRI